MTICNKGWGVLFPLKPKLKENSYIHNNFKVLDILILKFHMKKSSTFLKNVYPPALVTYTIEWGLQILYTRTTTKVIDS